MLTIDPHPLLAVATLETVFPSELGALASPEWLTALLRPDAPAWLERDEAVRTAVRDMLRSGGYKPTGRGKPASEYLVRAAEEGTLSSINLAVDVCNVVSLNSGLPISVIDLDRTTPPLRIGVAGAGERYVFNAAGQEIDLEGLLCIFDAHGPCANAVKDAERTKTRAETRRTLSVIWGVTGHRARLGQAVEWYAELLRRAVPQVQLTVSPTESP